MKGRGSSRRVVAAWVSSSKSGLQRGAENAVRVRLLVFNQEPKTGVLCHWGSWNARAVHSLQVLARNTCVLSGLERL